MTGKNFISRYFEDYDVGMKIVHPLPRMVTEGDRALYIALTGSRFPLHCSDPYAQALGYPRAPLEDMLVFHMVFGRTVPDLSLNAVANLGYAGCRFGVPVYVGDTLYADSVITGVRENSNGVTGTVYVHSRGWNQKGETVLEYDRWLMMRRRDKSAGKASPSTTHVPTLPSHLSEQELYIPPFFRREGVDSTLVGTDAWWDDYDIGEECHHIDGMTIEEAEHQMATRLYQNNARVHFNQHQEKDNRFGRRIIYGGHILSLARALSANGFAHAVRLAAIHGGSHRAPSFAGDTLYAWSKVIDKKTIEGCETLAAMRVRTIAAKDDDVMTFPDPQDKQAWRSSLVLDVDYTLLLPRRGA
ncbi:MAG: MaoC family dehydratase [Alphaproteobacteria bacterium GM7ARS4]|nr:MaoC family dehydratase [Alphaproteobacteria bacterium GM7ARS4]